MNAWAYVLHHSESIDPTLLDWIRHEIDAVLGLGPETIVVGLGALIVAFPVALMVLARRANSQAAEVTPGASAGDEGEPAADALPVSRRRLDRRRAGRV